mmetsp:Transcript_44137/g.93971  ORF Transcript_44137/g.93971 Transcript_44137/m.93971 type:complete len:291 (-) Transcript_44137:214-1086(-)
MVPRSSCNTGPRLEPLPQLVFSHSHAHTHVHVRASTPKRARLPGRPPAELETKVPPTEERPGEPDPNSTPCTDTKTQPQPVHARGQLRGVALIAITKVAVILSHARGREPNMYMHIQNQTVIRSGTTSHSEDRNQYHSAHGALRSTLAIGADRIAKRCPKYLGDQSPAVVIPIAGVSSITTTIAAITAIASVSAIPTIPSIASVPAIAAVATHAITSVPIITSVPTKATVATHAVSSVATAVAAVGTQAIASIPAVASVSAIATAIRTITISPVATITVVAVASPSAVKL